MRSQWQENKARPIGLQRQDFPYGHHLTHLPDSAQLSTQTKDVQIARNSSVERDEAERAEAEIYALPKSDSSDKSLSAPSSPPSNRASSPSPKRRRLNRGGNQHVDLIKPSSVKEERDPADIRSTIFTSSHTSSDTDLKSSVKLVSSSSPGTRIADKGESDHPFADYKAFQSKARKVYKKNPINFHKADIVKSGKKQGKMKPEKPISTIKSENDIRGFKIVDTEIPSPEKARVQPDFKQPAGLSSSSRQERASRRSAQEKPSHLSSSRQKTFKKPPEMPESLKREPSLPRFKVPNALPPSSNDGHSSRSKWSSQDNLSTDAPDLHKLEDRLGFAEGVRSNFQDPLKAPNSSATVSVGPSFDFDIDDGNSSSSLSSAPGLQELDALDFHDEWLKSHPPSSPKSQCPVCKTLVSRLFLEEFSRSGNLNVRQQLGFCKAHKIRSAQKVWRKKGYPSIEWIQFGARLPRYEEDMVGVINRTRRSFYRNAYEDQLKSGLNRTLHQALLSGNGWEGLNVGYYGTKGARILLEYTMSKFASQLRTFAVDEPLISAGGVAGYVQAVLVPELAVMLVKDDMDVDEEQARVILSESSEIGHLLNEEEDEVIKDAVEEVLVLE
ncbi:MAG: hypothetical protein Q9172_005756 [Xanthocarpia lactea]